MGFFEFIKKAAEKIIEFFTPPKIITPSRKGSDNFGMTSSGADFMGPKTQDDSEIELAKKVTALPIADVSKIQNLPNPPNKKPEIIKPQIPNALHKSLDAQKRMEVLQRNINKLTDPEKKASMQNKLDLLKTSITKHAKHNPRAMENFMARKLEKMQDNVKLASKNVDNIIKRTENLQNKNSPPLTKLQALHEKLNSMRGLMKNALERFSQPASYRRKP